MGTYTTADNVFKFSHKKMILCSSNAAANILSIFPYIKEIFVIDQLYFPLFSSKSTVKQDTLSKERCLKRGVRHQSAS